MNPYFLALTVIRLAALALFLFTAHSALAHAVGGFFERDALANFKELHPLKQAAASAARAFWTGALVNTAFALILFRLAPLLARLVAAGERKAPAPGAES